MNQKKYRIFTVITFVIFVVMLTIIEIYITHDIPMLLFGYTVGIFMLTLAFLTAKQPKIRLKIDPTKGRQVTVFELNKEAFARGDYNEITFFNQEDYDAFVGSLSLEELKRWRAKEMSYPHQEPGVCPVCNHDELEYNEHDTCYPSIADGECLIYKWECQYCHSKGKEVYHVEFDHQEITEQFEPDPEQEPASEEVKKGDFLDHQRREEPRDE